MFKLGRPDNKLETVRRYAVSSPKPNFPVILRLDDGVRSLQRTDQDATAVGADFIHQGKNNEL